MILTEAEARKKWCPFTQIGTHTERVIAEGGDEDDGKDWDSHTLVSGRGLAVLTAGGATNPHAVFCIASGCMAWRPAGIRHSCGKTDERESCKCLPVGGCGLAGKP